MKTSDSFALMEQLLPDLEELLGDDEIRAFKEEARGGAPIVASSAMQRLMPLFTGKHRDALLRVIAACNDKTVEQVESQELSDTIADMRSGFTDEVYSFFAQCLRLVLKA